MKIYVIYVKNNCKTYVILHGNDNETCTLQIIHDSCA